MNTQCLYTKELKQEGNTIESQAHLDDPSTTPKILYSSVKFINFDKFDAFRNIQIVSVVLR